MSDKLHVSNNKSKPRLDRRVQRTRTLLRDALIALIEERGYGSLSVQEIADRANVNRATFYLHYRDKEDLLIRSMQDVYDDLLARLGPLTPDVLLSEDMIVEIATLEHVREYIGFYRVMLGERGTPAFSAHLMDYIARVGQQLGAALITDGARPRVPLEAIAYYHAGAEMGLITWWVTNDMPCSVEEAARLLRALDRHRIQWALGLEDR